MGWGQSKEEPKEPEPNTTLSGVDIQAVDRKVCLQRKDKRRQYKVLIIGNSEVGKTTLRDVLTGKAFSETDKRSFGANAVHLEFPFLEETFHLCLYDTAGMDQNKSVVLSFLPETDCLIMAYAAYNKESLDIIVDKWLPDIMEKKQAKCIKHIFILGNQGDRRRDKGVKWNLEVDPLELEEKYEVKVSLNECSSKTGENIKEFFWIMVEELAKHESASHLDQLESAARK